MLIKVNVESDQEMTQSERTSHSKNRGGEKTNCQSGTNTKKVQVGKDQEKAQSEKDSHSKNRGGKKTN